jgi:hypothetical protein
MAYELGGKKKRPWFDALLDAFGVVKGLGASLFHGPKQPALQASAWWGAAGEGTPEQEEVRRIENLERTEEEKWRKGKEYETAKAEQLRKMRRTVLTGEQEQARAKGVGVVAAAPSQVAGAASPMASVSPEPATLDLEETEEERIARLKRKYLGKVTSPHGTAERRKLLLGGKGEPAKQYILGADDPRRKVSWRQY